MPAPCGEALLRRRPQRQVEQAALACRSRLRPHEAHVRNCRGRVAIACQHARRGQRWRGRAARGLRPAGRAAIARRRHAPRRARPRSARIRRGSARPSRPAAAFGRCRSRRRPGSRPRAAVRCWLRASAAISSGVSGGLSLSRQCSRNTSRKRIVCAAMPTGSNGSRSMQRTSTYSTPRSRSACSGRSPGEDHALRADGAVELVLDLQQRGRELVVVAARVADADGSRRAGRAGSARPAARRRSSPGCCS